MKILFITARYFPHRGGLESVVQHLAEEFTDKGHQVLIVSNRYPRKLPVTEVINEIQVIRLNFILPEIYHLKNLRFDLWLAGLWYHFFTMRALCSIIHRFQPDIVNTHYLNEVAEFSGRCLSKYFKLLPWIVSLHGGDVEGEPKLGYRHKERFLTFTRQAQNLTACSVFLANQAVEIAPELAHKITVVHNGVDVHRFSKAKPNLVARPYILAVGQLVFHKGFDILIKAFAPLIGKYPLVDLWIAGDGSHRQALEMLTREREMDGRVKMLGRVDENTVASIMAGALFIVVPSRKEPFGIVALEAMASGKLVLATPVGGLSEFIPCPPNRLVPPNISAWTYALDEWLKTSESDKLVSERNFNAANRLDWSKVAERYLEVYKQALQQYG